MMRTGRLAELVSEKPRPFPVNDPTGWIKTPLKVLCVFNFATVSKKVPEKVPSSGLKFRVVPAVRVTEVAAVFVFAIWNVPADEPSKLTVEDLPALKGLSVVPALGALQAVMVGSR